MKFTQHNMAKYSKYLLKKGYPILDTQNMYIKTHPHKQDAHASHASLYTMTTPPICPIPPTGSSALIAIMVASIVYDIFS
jgi:hypothetical protein